MTAYHFERRTRTEILQEAEWNNFSHQFLKKSIYFRRSAGTGSYSVGSSLHLFNVAHTNILFEQEVQWNYMAVNEID